jgi:hypothetical protein
MAGSGRNRLSLTEMLGAVAVVLSLVFVGIQIRENNRATMSAMASASIDSISAWYLEIGNNEQSSALIYHYLSDPNLLSAEERFQAAMNLHGVFLVFQNSYYLANEGTLEHSILHSVTEAIVGIREQPGFQLYWKQRRSIFLEGFQEYVDSILASDRKVSEGLFSDRNLELPSDKAISSP